MSLSSLPDELVVKIFGLLAHTGGDLASLKQSCKRFACLAKLTYKRSTAWPLSFKPVSSIDVRDWSQHQDLLAIPDTYGPCLSHTCATRDSEGCYYRGLYGCLSFRYIKFTELHMRMYDLRVADCILRVEHSNLDRVTSLHLSRCHLNARLLALILCKLKNLDHLNLHINYYHSRDQVSEPVLFVRRKLTTLTSSYDGEIDGDASHPLLHPNLELLTRDLYMVLTKHTVHGWEYIKRFRSQIEFIKVYASEPVDWPKLARHHGLENLACRMAWASDNLSDYSGPFTTDEEDESSDSS